MRILSLNCQRGYHPHLPLREFLQKVFEQGKYDFILLQEFARDVPAFVHQLGPYQLLKVYNNDVGEDAQVCVAYRSEYELVASDFVSFATKGPDPIVGITHSTFGFVCGRFTAQDRTIVVGSLHLHAGMSRRVRRVQMQTIKKHVLAVQKPGDAIVFGGDCNLGPREHDGIARLLSPEFVWVSGGLSPTLDGWYSENVRRLPNRRGLVEIFWHTGTAMDRPNLR